MSGTSLDGIDVALLTTDGQSVAMRGPSATYAYPRAFRTQLRQALADATAITERGQRPGCLPMVERELTQRHAIAVAAFRHQHGLGADAIDLIGFHGQTVLHRAPLGQRPVSRQAQGLTVQLGDGPLLARLTGTDVVYDMRAADMAAGGQGAPLVPVYHQALAAGIAQRPVAFLNVGGVANLTWVGADGALIAFDTGPGNAPIDDFVRARLGLPHDDGGRLTASGKPEAGTVKRFLEHAYFAAPPPKSLDRNAFEFALPPGISNADGAATLAACTANAVARAAQWLPQPPQMWVVCGGGRHNAGLMRALQSAVTGPVTSAEAVGLDGDRLEAEAWAYLAARSVWGLPLTFPGTTGVRQPMTGGTLAKARL